MPEFRVFWTEAARTDLETIIHYIAEAQPSTALRVLQKLETRTHTLQRFPKRGRIVPELRFVDVFLYRELVEKPWRIVYRIDDTQVYVMAVLDARRDPASLLLERLTQIPTARNRT